MKRCYKCKKHKSLDCFSLDSGTPDGKQRACKDCQRSIARESSKTVKGVFTQMYADQKKRQRERDHGCIPYSKVDLSKWCIENGFNNLYIRWVISEYKKDLKPSVDRIDDNKGYSFDNIRLVTWQENRNHQYSDIISATGTSGARCKAIIKYDKDMNKICEYVSLNEAMRIEGYQMQWAVENGTKTRKGHYWKYK